MNEPTPPRSAADTGHRRRIEWWQLVYLGVLLFQPALSGIATPIDWVVTGIIAATAVALFLVAERRRAPLLTVIVAFCALGTVGVFANGGAAVVFNYAAAYAGISMPRDRLLRWLTGVTVLMVGLFLVSPIPLLYRVASFAFPLAFVWIVGIGVSHDVERELEAARLRVDNARIERLAMLGERERIARDLHDLLGHTLTGIIVRAQLVQRVAASDPVRAVGEARDVEDMARSALQEVRATVGGWQHHALAAELDAARDTLAVAGVTLVVEQPTGLSLSTTVEAALALAVREAVTNVVRHAGAHYCTVALVTDGDLVRLTVTDDGAGKAAPDGRGVTGMRDRIAALGGRVEHHVDRGTVLTVTAPAQQVAS